MSPCSRFCSLCKQHEESTIWHKVWGYLDRKQDGVKIVDTPVFFVGKILRLRQELISPLLSADGLETVDIQTLPSGKENALEMAEGRAKSSSRTRHSMITVPLRNRSMHRAKPNALDTRKRKAACSSWLSNPSGVVKRAPSEASAASSSQILSGHMGKTHVALLLPFLETLRLQAQSHPCRFSALGEGWMGGVCKRRKLPE